jgi:hypothetical protein
MLPETAAVGWVRCSVRLSAGFLSPQEIEAMLLHDLEEDGALNVPERLAGLVFEQESEAGNQCQLCFRILI